MTLRSYINKNSGSNLCLVVILLTVVLLPLFKGGNYPGVMSLFLLSIALIFLLSLSELSYKRDLPWMIVWLVFTTVVLIHFFLVPIFFDNTLFFEGELKPWVLEKIGRRKLNTVRVIDLWSFFTSMWLFAWRVSFLSLKQISVILTVLFFAAFFQAFYGVLHFISDSTTVLGLWTKEHYLNDATGTFVNRNHFSGMLAVCSPVILFGLLASKPLVLPFLPKLYRILIAMFYLMVLVLALVSSHSRMGTVAAFFGLVVCFVVMIQSRSLHGKKSLILSALAIFLLVFLFLVWYGFEDILLRYADLGNGNSRLEVWQAMLDMPLNLWFVGVGPGAFEDVFKIITPNHFSVRFRYAHNDYLEFIFEFGLLLSLIIVCAFIYWFKYFYNSEDSHYLKSGVYGSIAAISLHSVVDFNLQIPASALCVWLSVGLLLNPSMIVDERSGNEALKKRKLKAKSRLPKNKKEWLEFLRSD